MSKIGRLNDSLCFSGVKYPAENLAEVAQRIGYRSVYAVGGMPAVLVDPLVRAAQVCDVPHTWRVKEAQTEAEVSNDTLLRGKEILFEDSELRGAHIICYIGSKDVDLSQIDLVDSLAVQRWDFLGAGAIRNKLNSNYFNPEVPVVSRAIVAPRFRGVGLGSVLVEHRLSLLLNSYFGSVPKAIHFGTESPKILTAVRRLEKELGIRFVHIGDEQLATDDGVHTVHDYLCFLPWYQRKISEVLDRCIDLLKTDEHRTAVKNLRGLWLPFMTDGVSVVSGRALVDSYQHVVTLPLESDLLGEVSDYFNELLRYRREIGVEDPSA